MENTNDKRNSALAALYAQLQDAMERKAEAQAQAELIRTCQAVVYDNPVVSQHFLPKEKGLAAGTSQRQIKQSHGNFNGKMHGKTSPSHNQATASKQQSPLHIRTSPSSSRAPRLMQQSPRHIRTSPSSSRAPRLMQQSPRHMRTSPSSSRVPRLKQQSPPHAWSYPESRNKMTHMQPKFGGPSSKSKTSQSQRYGTKYDMRHAHQQTDSSSSYDTLFDRNRMIVHNHRGSPKSSGLTQHLGTKSKQTDIRQQRVLKAVQNLIEALQLETDQLSHRAQMSVSNGHNVPKYSPLKLQQTTLDVRETEHSTTGPVRKDLQTHLKTKTSLGSRLLTSAQLRAPKFFSTKDPRSCLSFDNSSYASTAQSSDSSISLQTTSCTTFTPQPKPNEHDTKGPGPNIQRNVSRFGKWDTYLTTQQNIEWTDMTSSRNSLPFSNNFSDITSIDSASSNFLVGSSYGTNISDLADTQLAVSQDGNQNSGECSNSQANDTIQQRPITPPVVEPSTSHRRTHRRATIVPPPILVPSHKSSKRARATLSHQRQSQAIQSLTSSLVESVVHNAVDQLRCMVSSRVFNDQTKTVTSDTILSDIELETALQQASILRRKFSFVNGRRSTLSSSSTDSDSLSQADEGFPDNAMIEEQDTTTGVLINENEEDVPPSQSSSDDDSTTTMSNSSTEHQHKHVESEIEQGSGDETDSDDEGDETDSDDESDEEGCSELPNIPFRSNPFISSTVRQNGNDVGTAIEMQHSNSKQDERRGSLPEPESNVGPMSGSTNSGRTRSHSAAPNPRGRFARLSKVQLKRIDVASPPEKHTMHSFDGNNTQFPVSGRNRVNRLARMYSIAAKSNGKPLSLKEALKQQQRLQTKELIKSAQLKQNLSSHIEEA